MYVSASDALMRTAQGTYEHVCMPQMSRRWRRNSIVTSRRNTCSGCGDTTGLCAVGTDDVATPSDADAISDDGREGLLLCRCRGDGELPPAGVPGASAGVRKASLTVPDTELLAGLSSSMWVHWMPAVRQDALLASESG